MKARILVRSAAAAMLAAALSACSVGTESTVEIPGGHAAAVTALTAENFAAVVEQTPGVVVVDFWAAWCGPCRTMKPVFAKLAADYAGRARFGAVDVDSQKPLAEKFNVTGIPFFVIFKDGKAVDSRTGSMPEPAFRAWIGEHVK